MLQKYSTKYTTAKTSTSILICSFSFSTIANESTRANIRILPRNSPGLRDSPIDSWRLSGCYSMLPNVRLCCRTRHVDWPQLSWRLLVFPWCTAEWKKAAVLNDTSILWIMCGMVYLLVSFISTAHYYLWIIFSFSIVVISLTSTPRLSWNSKEKMKANFLTKILFRFIWDDQKGPACFLESKFLWSRSSKLSLVFPETHFFQRPYSSMPLLIFCFGIVGTSSRHTSYLNFPSTL